MVSAEPESSGPPRTGPTPHNRIALSSAQGARNVYDFDNCWLDYMSVFGDREQNGVSAMKTYPETIEHRWDILYRDYPEIYDEFSSFPYTPLDVDIVNRTFPLAGKIVVDCGSGNGKSTFSLAEY